MAGPGSKKRGPEGRTQRPPKKQKRSKPIIKQQDYHSDSDEEEGSFDPVNLLDSDDDIHNATVDDGAASDDGQSSSEEEQTTKKTLPKKKMTLKAKKPEAEPQSEDDSEDEQQGQAEDSDADSDEDEEDDYDENDTPAARRAKSKKRDNTAFATSLSKILNTKLTTTKRADPVLSRSVEAHEASRAIQDSALEAKAKKQMRDQRRAAFEKGRVKDVLVATRDEKTGETEATTSEIMETERRLRKVAQRGVVKLFNAVRAAQVAATDAEKGVRKAGMIGMDSRQGKVNELSKKGFLDLIASGGGGLKKTALEEA